MPVILNLITLPTTNTSIKEDITQHVALLNDFIEVINNYTDILIQQRLDEIRQLRQTKKVEEKDAKSEESSELTEHYNEVMKKLREAANQKRTSEKRKRIAAKQDGNNPFLHLTAEQHCAVYTGIRSIEYAITVLINYLEKQAPNSPEIIAYLKQYLQTIITKKADAIAHMKEFFAAEANAEEENRKASAAAHPTIHNSGINSVVLIPEDIKPSQKIDTSTLGSFVALPDYSPSPASTLNGSMSFVQVPAPLVAPHNDPLKMSTQSQDKSIHHFMCVDIFTAPIFPDKNIGDDLDITVYDYFENQINNGVSTTQNNINAINQALNPLNTHQKKTFWAYFSPITTAAIATIEYFAPATTGAASPATNNNAAKKSDEKPTKPVTSTTPTTSNRFGLDSSFAVIPDTDEQPTTPSTTAANSFGFGSSFNLVPNENSKYIDAAKKGIKEYLTRNGNHLCFFVKLFDGNKGKKRAKEYQRLLTLFKPSSLLDDFESLLTADNTSKIQMAILTALVMSHDGKTLQNDVIKNIKRSMVTQSTEEDKFTKANNFNLKKLREEMGKHIRTILGNDDDKVALFNQKFLGPFINSMNNNKPIPDSAFICLAKLIGLDNQARQELMEKIQPIVQTPNSQALRKLIPK